MYRVFLQNILFISHIFKNILKITFTQHLINQIYKDSFNSRI